MSDVDLSVHPGEVVALLGPNGSGKSTLVRGALGLVERQGGEVLLLGTPRERFDEHTRIGYVPQRHSLSTSVRATVTEIVAVGRLPHRPWWRPAGREDREAVAAAIEDVGLADRADEEVASLSGGQQRRVLIARALAGRPDLLLMDEPTAGVDHASQGALAVVLRRLAARGTSMLVVTHELDALEDVVTRIVCMDVRARRLRRHPARVCRAPRRPRARQRPPPRPGRGGPSPGRARLGTARPLPGGAR